MMAPYKYMLLSVCTYYVYTSYGAIHTCLALHVYASYVVNPLHFTVYLYRCNFNIIIIVLFLTLINLCYVASYVTSYVWMFLKDTNKI